MCRISSRRGGLRQIHIESGRVELRPARAVLNAAGVFTHVEIGRTAETIVSFATEIRCDRIVIGQGPQTSFTDELFGTLASEIRHLLGGAAPCQVVTLFLWIPALLSTAVLKMGRCSV